MPITDLAQTMPTNKPLINNRLQKIAYNLTSPVGDSLFKNKFLNKQLSI